MIVDGTPMEAALARSAVKKAVKAKAKKEQPMSEQIETIYDWTAKRAGGRITVYGKTREGNPRRIVGVDHIHPRVGEVRAVDKNGRNYRLDLS